MKKRALGQSGMMVSEIGFGCMSLGTSAATALPILHKAYEHGVNFFDTADLYDHGRNEELVGEAFRGRRGDVFIATKVGNRFEPGKANWTWDPSPAYIEQAVEASLRRLQTDYIDLYQLHGGTVADPMEDVVETFERLKKRGVIRAYGISSIRPNVILSYLRSSGIDSVMMQYNLLDRRPEEWFADIEQSGVSVIARGSLARGLLTDAKRLSEGESYVDRVQVDIDGAKRVVSALATEGRTEAQVSLRYALSPPVVASALPGASSIAQLEENIQAASAPTLTSTDIRRLQNCISQNAYQEHRPTS